MLDEVIQSTLSMCQHSEYTHCRHILIVTGWGYLRNLGSATDVELSSPLGRNYRHNGYLILFLVRVLTDAESVFFNCRERSNGLRHPPDIGYPCGVSSDYQLSMMNESAIVPSCTKPTAVVDQERYLLGNHPKVRSNLRFQLCTPNI